MGYRGGGIEEKGEEKTVYETAGEGFYTDRRRNIPVQRWWDIAKGWIVRWIGQSAGVRYLKAVWIIILTRLEATLLGQSKHQMERTYDAPIPDN